MLSILPSGRTPAADSAPQKASGAPDAATPPVAVPPNAATDPAAEEAVKATRWPAAAVPAIKSLRISPRGIEATLVNISTTGLLAESVDRLQTGSVVTVVFEGTFVPDRVRGTVVRNSVSSVGSDGALRYHVGVCFMEPIRLEVEEQAKAPTQAAPATATALAPHRVVRNRW